MAGQSLLVRSDETAITSKDTLKGKKVCSVTGSTPIQRVKDQELTEPENIVEFQTYTQCVDQLLNNQVDAVTTDDAILNGYAAQQPDKLKLVGEPFSTEPYGIGLNKDDAALRNKINDILQAAEDDGTWKQIYDGTLGKSGSPGRPAAAAALLTPDAGWATSGCPPRCTDPTTTRPPRAVTVRPRRAGSRSDREGAPP